MTRMSVQLNLAESRIGEEGAVRLAPAPVQAVAVSRLAPDDSDAATGLAAGEGCAQARGPSRNHRRPRRLRGEPTPKLLGRARDSQSEIPARRIAASRKIRRGRADSDRSPRSRSRRRCAPWLRGAPALPPSGAPARPAR